MIIKEFSGHRMALLEAHSFPLWEFTVGGDPMCLHVSGLTHDELDRAFGDPLGLCPEYLPQATLPLYACDDMEGMVTEMSSFDEWGLVGLHKGSPITLSSSGEDGSDLDSQATEG
ncbi:hypothetical protein D1007_37667 [Hordeum vulgare]|nr:hypothetical protein D1007_37667 [Hordeum vulgare]